MDFASITKPFRVDKPAAFRLSACDPGDCLGLSIEKSEAKAMLADGTKRLNELQERLYAEDRWAVLIILQGMDAAGKDSLIKHVIGAINPQGCEVHSFKAPSAEELDHDFLWRHAVRLPTRGRIGIFNRSHYEEVVVVRVHPEFLGRQKLPEPLMGKDIWQRRFEDIRNFEQSLAHNGTAVLKFFLNVSREEQRERMLERLDRPEKHWKFNAGDIAERKLWPRYLAAYEDAIRNTSTAAAPWYVVPADHKWFCQLVVAAALVETLEALNPKFPPLDAADQRVLASVRRALEAEAHPSGRGKKRGKRAPARRSKRRGK
jgi:PPK2 family polyphosphate:nucleotide phosphotransferase